MSENLSRLTMSDIGNADSLKRFFELMLALLRVINAVVVSRGSANEQTMSQARNFLKENRASIVGVLKRHAKIGGVHVDVGVNLDDLVDNYTFLMSATNFLEVC